MIHRIVACCLAVVALSQAQPREPRVVSPQVHPDRRVTLRLRAPKANEVTVTGEFTPKPLPLTKDESGVWSITLDALEPDIYGYTLRVDGLGITDPANAFVKTGIRGHSSALTVHGEKPLAWDSRPVPHGAVHRHHYESTITGDLRAFTVYTPPQYDPRSNTKYPVLYLLHGSGDHDMSWVEYGRANFILDNLIADGKAKPAMVVMPYGQMTAPHERLEMPGSSARFEQDLLNEVIPRVEKLYKTETAPEHRAIAGLSMGGGQSLWTGLNNLDRFGWVGGFSSALMGFSRQERLQKSLSNLRQRTNVPGSSGSRSAKTTLCSREMRSSRLG